MEADTFAQQRLARKHSTRSSPDAASRPQQRASVTAAAAAGSSEVTSLAAAVQSLDGDNPFYEYAMIVPSSRKASKLLQRRIGELHEAGLQTRIKPAMMGKETIVEVGVTLQRLAEFATATGFAMKLDEHRLEATAAEGVPAEEEDDGGGGGGWVVPPISVPTRPSLYRPYEHMYAPFFNDPRRYALFWRETIEGKEVEHPFQPLDRVKLVRNILQAPTELKARRGPDWNLSRMNSIIKVPSVLAVFPLHDRKELKHLYKVWMKGALSKLTPWAQPYDEIRDYFGEQIGFYFYFLGHYTTWLMALGVFGFLIFVYSESADPQDAITARIFYCFCLSVWMILLMQSWIRKQRTKAKQWGMADLITREPTRPAFEGSLTPSVVTGRPELYFPRWVRSLRKAVVTTTVAAVLIGVVAIVWALFTAKNVIAERASVPGVGVNFIASLLVSVQIFIMDTLYRELAYALTKWENHRLESAFVNNLVARLFIFRFVNSYSSLYYIAFVKASSRQGCVDGDCVRELQIQLATLLILNQFIASNLYEFLEPKIRKLCKHKVRTRGGRALSERNLNEDEAAAMEDYDLSTSQAEMQYSKLVRYDNVVSLVKDYNEVATEFGYATLFSAAFPLAPLLASVVNLCEIRVDAHKLMFDFRRVEPVEVSGIGTYYSLFNTMATMGILTNLGIIVFTLDTFVVSDTTKIWIFMLMQYGMFALSLTLAIITPEVPLKVEVQLKRERFVVRRVVMQSQEIDEYDDDEAKDENDDMEEHQGGADDEEEV